MATITKQPDKSVMPDDRGRNRVLVVEDELSQRVMTLRALRRSG